MKRIYFPMLIALWVLIDSCSGSPGPSSGGSGSGGSPSSIVISANGTGNNGGYYYSYWSNGQGTVKMTLGSGGEYSVDWQNCGDFTCGKGWSTGSAQSITYNAAAWSPSGNAYLAVYGWTTSPLIEYYIVDSWGSWRPAYVHVGTVVSDGGTYDIYTNVQVNQPSIVGNATFTQWWSVRQSARTTGGDNTITTANHFNAWKSLGATLGTFNYQIVLVEGYESSGFADITVGGTGTN